jgi:hypothetical protein
MCGPLRPRHRDVVTHGEKGMTLPDIDNINHVGMAVSAISATRRHATNVLAFNSRRFRRIPARGSRAKRCSG